jgi:hypothetical protein
MAHARGWKVGVAVLFAAACGSVAQVPTTERHRLLPDIAPAFVAHRDVDGDGDVDLVYRDGAALLLVANDGTGRFSVSSLIAAQVASAPFALGDIDGDGDLDVAIGGVWGYFGNIPTALFRNDGAGTWTDVSAQWITANEVTTAIHFVDFDGDGDVDLLTLDPVIGSAAAVQPNNRLYLNNGSGAFTDATASHIPAPGVGNTSVVVGDLDGDGDRDLVFTSLRLAASAGGVVRTLLQNPAGIAYETPGIIPAAPIPYGGYYAVELLDFEGDGDLDVALTSTVGLQLFTNGGGGSFALSATLPLSDAYDLTVADVDGDGRPDLFSAGTFFHNTTAGFVEATAAHVELPDLLGALRSFDVDQDGDIDLFANVTPQPLLWHNDGQGRLLQILTEDLAHPYGRAALLGDMEGDGDFDALCLEEYAQWGGAYVSTNSGRGPTARVTQLVPFGLQHARCVAWIDADQDGDLDAFVGTAGTPWVGVPARDYLFHNVAGSFVDVTATHLPPVGGTERITVGDVDGDGLMDLLSSRRVLVGDGSGGFTLGWSFLSPTTLAYEQDVWIDFDGDGDLDAVQAVHANGGTPLLLLANQWPAGFTDVTSSYSLPAVSVWSLNSCDVDADGRPDLLAGSYWTSGGTNGIHVLRSLPSGFVDETAARMPLITNLVIKIDVADVDGDGLEDVRYETEPGTGTHLLRNVGGVFIPDPALALLPWPLARSDFDADGDDDVIGESGLLRNRLRDLQNAVPPRVGLAAEIVAHAYDGNGTDPQAVLLLLAPQLASPPIVYPGLGTLFLDPATASYHSTHLIPGTGGEAVVGYTVPSSPGVLGTAVFAQAVFVHEPDPATWRLGNVLELRVRL